MSEKADTGASQWLWLSALVIALDQYTKWLVVRNFELYESLTVWPILDLRRLHNTGAAFSFLSDADGWQRWLFIALGLIVSVVILFWLRRTPRRGEGWLAAGLALIVGGALGNVIDRAVHQHVIDFLHFHWNAWYFPAFNVADTAITAGAICLVIDALFMQKNKAPNDTS